MTGNGLARPSGAARRASVSLPAQRPARHCAIMVLAVAALAILMIVTLTLTVVVAT